MMEESKRGGLVDIRNTMPFTFLEKGVKGGFHISQ